LAESLVNNNFIYRDKKLLLRLRILKQYILTWQGKQVQVDMISETTT
jgi:hypothetical protein